MIVVTAFIVSFYHYKKSVPKGISVNGDVHKVENVEFIYDLTYQQNDEKVMEQKILDRALQIIEDAEEFVLLDIFLFNDDYDREKGDYPNVAGTVTNALVEKKKSNPDIEVTLITDPINTFYGSYETEYFETLKENNVDVIITNLKPLKDSNPVYSGFWRSYLQWFSPSENGFLPNLFNPDGPKGSIASYLNLINFKANHRKVVMNETEALVTSSNIAHDGSSYHSNIGFIVKGNIIKDIYESEKVIVEFSGGTLEERNFETHEESGDVLVNLVTEGEINKELQKLLDEAEPNSEVKIGVFYMSDRELLKSLVAAAKRQVNIQIILDPNKDAFGIEKNGIPNRQVGHELLEKGKGNIQIKWYDTHGEQFHSKMMIVKNKHETTVIGGSANFTKRNIADFNLENNIKMVIPSNHELDQQFTDYYSRLWENKDGEFTTSYESYEDTSLWKKTLYRFQEWSGMSTF